MPAPLIVRLAGGAATLGVPAAVAALVAYGPHPAQLALGAITLAALIVLLAHAWRLADRASAEFSPRQNRWIRFHLAAHVVPLALASWVLARNEVTAPSTLWTVAFVMFFYSGRHTWACLHQRYGTPLYLIFKRGNTAILITTLLLTLVGTLLPWHELLRLLGKLLHAYTAIHLTLTPIAVSRIETDLASSRDAQRN